MAKNGGVSKAYRAKSVLRVMACAKRDVKPELSGTVIGRGGVEVYRVEKIADARLIASSLGVGVILVDRDFPDAAGLIKLFRKDPATRERSIAVLIRGPKSATDREWLNAGANDVFHVPPDADWDERFSKLVTVPMRQESRLAVNFSAKSNPDGSGAVLNVSPGGMLLQSDRELEADEELNFDFLLPDGTVVSGRGRVARIAPARCFGIEFISFVGEGRDAVLDFLKSARRGEQLRAVE